MKINLKELDKEKEKNFLDRLKFIDLYVEWLKKTGDKKAFKVHNKFVNSLYSKK